MSSKGWSNVNVLTDEEIVYLDTTSATSAGSPSVDGTFSESDDGDFVLVPHTPLASRNPALPLPASSSAPAVAPVPEEKEKVHGTDDAELETALASLSLTRTPKPQKKQTPSPKQQRQIPKPTAAPVSPSAKRRRRRARTASPTPSELSISRCSAAAVPGSAYPSPPVSPAPSAPSTASRAPSVASSYLAPPTVPMSRRARKRLAAQRAKGQGLGQGVVDDFSDTTGMSVVDDFSDTLSELSDSDCDERARDMAVVKAQQYIASYLANPPPVTNNGMLLPLLQALIVELGILSSPSPSTESTLVVPRTLTAARALLKSRAFISVREYLVAREEGPDALARVMHPSRGALVKALRKQSDQRAPKDWVKKSGLGVLLVDLHF